MVFTNKKRGFRYFTVVFLLGFAFLILYGCAGCSEKKAYLEAAQAAPRAPVNSEASNDTPIKINCFFDRTESMRGFTKQEDSAYKKTMRALWEAVENLPLPSQPVVSYYVYGDTQIGSQTRSYIASNTGLRSESFYGKGDESKLGQKVQSSYDKPFHSVYEYIHKNIDPGSRSLYVVVTDLYETDNPNDFATFFKRAFEKDLSGAIFAVESDFSGILYDVYTEKEKKFESNGFVTSTFFILVIGSQSEVLIFSEKLFDDLQELGKQGKNIDFFNTVFLVGPNKKFSPVRPKFVGGVEKGNRERKGNEFSIVHLGMPTRNDPSLGLYRWEGTPPKSIPARVEIYQVMSNYGSRYVRQLTDKSFRNFEYPVEAKIRFNEGEEEEVKPGFISVFRPYPNIKEFKLYAEPKPAKAEDKTLARPLYLKADVDTTTSGFYEIEYNIKAKAITPEWVTAKNAGEIADVEASRDKDKKLKVYRLKTLYDQIAVAYNLTGSRAGWSGKFYLVRIN